MRAILLFKRTLIPFPSPTSPTLLLLLLLLPSTLLLQLSSTVDRLRLGESISSNQTLSSSNGAFILGFFSPSKSTANSYLGIWLIGSAPQTAVWVANGAAPIIGSSGMFRLSNDTNLEVADSKGTVLWSSGLPLSSNASANNINTMAVLSDYGNLQILGIVDDSLGGGSIVLWQSFDHATDTVLPKMPIWANYRTHTAAIARSWKTEEDPAPGNYTLSIDPDTPLQGIVRRGSSKWWRSNVWKGVSYSGLPLNSSVLPFVSYSLSPEWWNMSFTSSQSSLILAVRLEYDGLAVMRIWLQSSKTWYRIYTFNTHSCESYGLCGPFGYCSQTPPTCRCLDRFVPRNNKDWAGGDFQGGCVRRNALLCDGRDLFERFEDMKLPDHNIFLRHIMNASACREECRSNCSCLAYAYSDLWTGTSETTPRCLVWTGDLIDLVARNDTSGEDLYVRFQVADTGTKKKDAKVVLVVPLVAGFAFLVGLTCLVWKYRKCGGPCEEEEEVNLSIDVRRNGEDMSTLVRQSQDLPLLEYEVAVFATNNFSSLNKIGQGGFGIVYKGKLPSGQEVAIKRLSQESSQGYEEFKNEVVLIAQLRHRNLVKLLYCCIHGEEKLLIYEYMPNKSLELFLFDSEIQRLLNWEKRFNIIKGIARGLLYLHEESRLKVIHRDLKASNILLDGDMNPKISDFGMARIFGGSQNQANTRRVVGTYGYMSPEYAMEGLFSVKSDVYSFGVLLLEIISGRRNTSFHPRGAFPSLLSFAWESWQHGNLMEIVAPPIQDSCTLLEVAKCIHIGLLSVQDDPNDRPNMSSLVFMLENETSIPSIPEKPKFTGWTCHDESIQQIQSHDAFSGNHLSVTVLEGR